MRQGHKENGIAFHENFYISVQWVTGDERLVSVPEGDVVHTPSMSASEIENHHDAPNGTCL